MLHAICLLSLVLVISSGIIVLYIGEWRKSPMKYAAISMSILSAFFMLFTHCFYSGLINLDDRVYSSYELYSILRNISLILFHVIVGKDSIGSTCFYSGTRRFFVHNIKKL